LASRSRQRLNRNTSAHPLKMAWMPDVIPTENVDDVSRRAERRRFLKYAAGAAVLAAAAAAGFYFVMPPPAPTPKTSTATITSSSPLGTVSTSGTQMGLTLTSEAFREGERIPSRHTCDGQNISPPMTWSGGPDGARSYALIMDDIDAPSGRFTHWVIFNIPATASRLEENVPAVETLPNGAKQGINGFGEIGYGGPCPPFGTHRYVFHLYALDTLLDLPQGASREDVVKAMQGHTLAGVELTGLYGRG